MKSTLILLFFLFFQTLSAQNLYVDNAIGSNSNSGTSLASPWKTIQHAMDNASAGNVVYIRTGVYYEALELNVSGLPGTPITFKNYNGETVAIDGNNTAVTLLYIVNKSNITIEGLVFQNTLGNNSAGVLIKGKSKNIIFRKNKIQHIDWTASVLTTPGSNDNSNPFLVYGTNATAAASNIIVDSNEVFNNITGFSESLTMDGNVDGFTISNNLVHDNVNIGILCAGNYKVSSDPATDHARNGLVKNNTVYTCVSNYATSAGIYVDGGKNIIVEKNKTYGNGYGIEIGCEELGTTENITVRDNVVFDNAIAGLAIGGYNYPATGQVLNCLIENNSLYKNDVALSGSGEFTITKTSGCTFRNNILYTNGQNTAVSSAYGSLQGNVFNYNAYYVPSGTNTDLTFTFNNSTYTGLSDFQSSTSQESNGIFTDPLFVNTNVASPVNVDLSLQAGSLCIDAGKPGHAIVANETDYYNFNRVANSQIDIGATEYGSIISGIESIAPTILFTLFPNPVFDILSIRTDQKSAISSVSIINFVGEEIYVTNNVNETISFTLFPKGFYLVKIITENGCFAQKILKQ
jgi:hypothetical protein